MCNSYLSNLMYHVQCAAAGTWRNDCARAAAMSSYTMRRQQRIGLSTATTFSNSFKAFEGPLCLSVAVAAD
jgi:hypothetical protein